MEGILLITSNQSLKCNGHLEHHALPPHGFIVLLKLPTKES